MSIGDRLREERKHLGFTQTTFGELAGLRKQSTFHYESGKRSPDARYLAAIAEAGADILYIVTGRREGAAPSVAAVAPHDDAKTIASIRQSLAEAARDAGSLAQPLTPEAATFIPAPPASCITRLRRRLAMWIYPELKDAA